MSAPCPCCDCERASLGPLDSMALGVALGAAFGEPHGVTELVCPKHRTPWVLAMMKAAIATNDEVTP